MTNPSVDDSHNEFPRPLRLLSPRHLLSLVPTRRAVQPRRSMPEVRIGGDDSMLPPINLDVQWSTPLRPVPPTQKENNAAVLDQCSLEPKLAFVLPY